MKFEDAFRGRLSEAVKLVVEVREVCNSCGRLLDNSLNQGKHGDNNFYVTALQFTRINYDTIACIKHGIQSGFLTQSFVLLRWHLELAHLFYYLWKDQEAYRRWVQGEQIRPREIGKFIEEEGSATWEETYLDWSNVTHGNALYVENCFTISRMTPIDDKQVILAGHALRNLMFMGHKINMVSGNLLKELVDVAEYNPIAEKYNSLDDDIWAYSHKQNREEDEMLSGDNE